MKQGPAYLDRLSLKKNGDYNSEVFPFTLPFVQDMDIQFDSAVSFLVGENGSGKSTIMEAIAQLCRLPVGGGSRNEIGGSNSPHVQSELAPALLASFITKPKNGYFFRAEFQAHFASLLEERENDPNFWGDPYARYGGRSLHTRSHGEAFLAMFEGLMEPGILLMDEPESALSPQRQLALLHSMADLVQGGNTQFVIATHSPILLTFPNATIFNFVDGFLRPVELEETEHYQITKGVLDDPHRYWRHLMPE